MAAIMAKSSMSSFSAYNSAQYTLSGTPKGTGVWGYLATTVCFERKERN